MSILSEISSQSVSISQETRAYFQERLRLRIYDIILSEFIRSRDEAGLTQRALAAKMGKRPEQVNRWLATPSNWTIDTLSDLLLCISGSELSLSVSVIAEQAKRNLDKPEWMAGKSLPGWVQAEQVKKQVEKPKTDSLYHTKTNKEFHSGILLGVE